MWELTRTDYSNIRRSRGVCSLRARVWGKVGENSTDANDVIDVPSAHASCGGRFAPPLDPPLSLFLSLSTIRKKVVELVFNVFAQIDELTTN